MEIMDSIKYICEHSEQLQSEKKKKCAIVIQKETEVTYGFENDCDKEWCAENNIPCFDRNSGGGCIVHAKGNISVTLVYSHDEEPGFLGIAFVNNLIRFLEGKGLNCSFEHNDVLVDGYKVASGYDNNLPPDWRWCKTGLQISMNQELNIIEHACKKPMIKTPKGLSEYGITTQDIMDNVVLPFVEMH